jgi:protein disulfide-isomerase A6
MTYLLFLIFISFANAFYESASSKVERLTAANFDKVVMKSDEIWFVEFYAPWCGHCKSLEPHWDTAARKMKGVVRFGAIDVDDAANKAIGSQYGISGFPTIKIFGLNKKTAPSDYNGGREADPII